MADASRYVAAVVCTGDSVVAACAYRHADCLPKARQHGRAVAKGLSFLGRPWVALGDWNAENDAPNKLFAN